MRISDIARQKRRADRYSIYVEGEYKLSLSEQQLLDAGLRIGDELDEVRLAQLVADSDFGKVLDKVYNLLSYRPRSRQEVVAYLRRKGYEDELASQIVSRLEEQDLLNDARFAKAWVEHRQMVSPRSRIQLQTELRQKGLSKEIIDEALAEATTPDQEIQVVRELVASRRLRERYPDERKLIQHLAGKGFPISTIKTALQQPEVE